MPEIDVNGAKIAYREAGEGETVILLHSSASSGGQWRSLQAALSSTYHVLAPDLHGYGDSEAWPGEGALTLAGEAAIVSALMSRSAGPVHLVGHSYGGAVALRAALEQPHRLRSLTLIEPVAFHVLREGDAMERELYDEVVELGGVICRAALNGDYAGGMAHFVDYWNGEGAWAHTRKDMRKALSRCVCKVALDFSATLNEPTPVAAYRSIDVPTLILGGVESLWPTHGIAERLAASLPEARLRMIETAGHMAPLTHADTVNALIADHLNRCTGVWRQAA